MLEHGQWIRTAVVLCAASGIPGLVWVLLFGRGERTSGSEDDASATKVGNSARWSQWLATSMLVVGSFCGLIGISEAFSE